MSDHYPRLMRLQFPDGSSVRIVMRSGIRGTVTGVVDARKVRDETMVNGRMPPVVTVDGVRLLIRSIDALTVDESAQVDFVRYAEPRVRR